MVEPMAIPAIRSWFVALDRQRILPDLPEDVRRTAEWLEVSGFELVSAEPRHGMGFSLLDYVAGADRIRIVSDRDQWMLDVQVEGWDSFVDFDILCTVTGVVTSDDRYRPGRATQLPPGVVWATSLPAVLDWCRSTEDALSQARDAQRERARSW
jgi:hypothetical protein